MYTALVQGTGRRQGGREDGNERPTLLVLKIHNVRGSGQGLPTVSASKVANILRWASLLGICWYSHSVLVIVPCAPTKYGALVRQAHSVSASSRGYLPRLGSRSRTLLRMQLSSAQCSERRVYRR